MSCFLLTDKHVSTIAARFAVLYSWDFKTAKEFANRLKYVNIDSVNVRYSVYSGTTSKRAVSVKSLVIALAKAQTLPMPDNDVAALIVCWNYQSDNAQSLDYRLMRDFLFGAIDRMGWQLPGISKSIVWAI